MRMEIKRECMRLVRPSAAFAEEIAAFKKELIDSLSRRDGCGELFSAEDPLSFIEASRNAEQRETQKKGLVPATQFLYADEESGTVVGMINVRHELNDSLARLGGQIGYCIRPCFRGQGFAEPMLSLALEFCREELGLSMVMISCHRDNPASEHTILACGGKRNRIVTDPETGKEASIFYITDETRG